ncbi:hypothetical protein [Pseudomonas arsenicoxydans]|uniref:Uncharacterized protein n=1 Tax=Pseudomonas arsenicoxydans TaxID=702115 RepID=A0A502GU10_9PSED|nr:hypothetical protein [Pseudomonas arsenicoxydans]TPG65719.1 hypothetical protein EAH78_31545 [Pseudomonas arsenicoxydans]
MKVNRLIIFLVFTNILTLSLSVMASGWAYEAYALASKAHSAAEEAATEAAGAVNNAKEVLSIINAPPEEY